MALKQKIAKAVYAALPDVLKAEYKVSTTDAEEYGLDVEGMEDTGALKRAKDREVENAKNEKLRADKLQADLDAALGGDATTRARKAGDIDALEKSWGTQKEAAVNEVKGTLAKRDAFIMRRLVDDEAKLIAARISTAPSILLPHLRARLQADMTGDEPIARVLDGSGKMSALTIAELEKEFVANKDFAAIIKASDASGGGAAGGKQGSGGAAKKFADMSGSERAAYAESDKAGFDRDAAAAKAAGPKI